MDDYSDYDGVGLAALVRKGEVTPGELVEAAITRIERHNPAINAVVYKPYDEARAKADNLPDGPLRGAPFLVKDLLIEVAGWPRTSGSRFFKNVVDREDDGLMRRYRESGVSALGKTNLSEFGIAGTTEGALFGPCRNPWNLEHMVGGSSGGAAAAVAAGMVPMAHGGDGRGSIRIPASCCGLVGLKPTRDRSPHLPDGYDFAQGFVVEHVLTRTVRDSAVMLDVTGRPEPASPYAAPAKERPYAEEILRSPGRLKIAFSSETANGRPCHPEIQAALEATAALLEKLGHEVVPQGLPVAQRDMWGAQNAFSGANFAAGMRRMIEASGREPQGDDFEGLTWASWKGGQRAGGMDALADMQSLRMLARQALQLWETYDVFLTPTMAAPPPKLGHLSPVLNAPRDIGRRNGEFFSYPGVANMTGQPSISLPLAWSSDGLPMGMMFTSRYADEATLFRLAAQLEKEAPWKDRRPGVWG
ncbi:MAG TPA: amidase family protein [Caulobacteraceae bacterium]|jgi:amidase|nr:amidase family protein [Caulobacteraceae bacterium]